MNTSCLTAPRQERKAADQGEWNFAKGTCYQDVHWMMSSMVIRLLKSLGRTKRLQCENMLVKTSTHPDWHHLKLECLHLNTCSFSLEMRSQDSESPAWQLRLHSDTFPWAEMQNPSMWDSSKVSIFLNAGDLAPLDLNPSVPSLSKEGQNLNEPCSRQMKLPLGVRSSRQLRWSQSKWRFATTNCCSCL